MFSVNRSTNFEVLNLAVNELKLWLSFLNERFTRTELCPSHSSSGKC